MWPRVQAHFNVHSHQKAPRWHGQRLPQTQAGFWGALFKEVRPPSEKENCKNTFNSIKGPKFRFKSKFSDSPGDLAKQGVTVSTAITTATVDSGACDSIAPPSVFPKTATTQGKETGRVYGACGGEAVRNLGCKQVAYMTEENEIKTAEFQIGDKITKPLLAVSQ